MLISNFFLIRKKNFANDIALIRLAKNFTLSNNVKTIGLPASSFNASTSGKWRLLNFQRNIKPYKNDNSPLLLNYFSLWTSRGLGNIELRKFEHFTSTQESLCRHNER